MSKKRFATGGTGYQTAYIPKRSKIRYGLLIDPAKADNKDTPINLTWISEHVRTSKSCHISYETFMDAMRDYAENPHIVWDRETAKDEFLEMCTNVWDNQRVA